VYSLTERVQAVRSVAALSRDNSNPIDFIALPEDHDDESELFTFVFTLFCS
jgi:hypothetical protein